MKTPVVCLIILLALTSFVNQNTSNAQCLVAIPGNTAVYNAQHSQVVFSNNKGTDHNWVCTGDTLDIKQTQNQKVYLEPNAVLVAALNNYLFEGICRYQRSGKWLLHY